MPPVAAFTVAFAAGLWVGRLVMVPAVAAVVVACTAAVLWRSAPWRALLVIALGIGLAYGGRARRVETGGCAAVWGAGRRAAIVRLHDAPDGRDLAEATILHAPEGCGGRVRLRIPAGAVGAGAVAVVAGRYAPGGALRASRVREFDRSRARRFVLRDALARRVARLYGPRAPIVDALVLGRRGDVEPALRAAFAASGLAHLLAISGLHVGILAGWVVLLVRPAVPVRWRWVAGAVGAWLFVALLGFPAPATRAAAFVTVHGLARLRHRHPLPDAVLAAAMLLVLWVDPDAITATGAWLSAAAVWGTGRAQAVLPPTRRRAWRRLLAASVGATLATAPLTAFAFGAVAPVGIVANLVAVPLAGVVVPAVFGSLLLGTPLAAGAGLGLAALERLATLGAAVPLGHLRGDAGVPFALPWIVLLVIAAWWATVRPTWSVVGRRLALAGACASWLGLGVAHWPARHEAGLTMYVLAVGQGDAIALRTPGGRWLLVDAGPRAGGVDAGRRVVVPFLRRHGVRTLDALVLTHGDADHLGGAPAVVDALRPALVLEPGQPLGTALYLEHLAAVDRAGGRWQAARAGDLLEVDDVRIEVLHPDAAWIARELRPNENSIVLRVRFGAFDALLTGDIGWPAESALVARVGPVEVLKVGHHGSAGSTTPPWLAAVRPMAAIVSVGANRYGHPAPVVLERLTAVGTTIYRTDRGGTVTIRSDGRYFAVTQGNSNPLPARLLCVVRDWLRSRASSSSRSGCSPRPRESSPTSSTTWPSLPRSSRVTCGGPGSPPCSGVPEQ